MHKRGSCVIVGRCADQILEQDYSCLKVFLYADFDKRYQRAITQYDDKAQGIEDFVRKKDKSRKRFFQIFHEKEWEKANVIKLRFGDIPLLKNE
ncbi:MAG: cytidylate kinase-like family protein, partial [Erysipelotrichaceae bacterium]|nr:cytidylate kinase-like family protein [Erysipelotrichaceae bacterium]